MFQGIYSSRIRVCDAGYEWRDGNLEPVADALQGRIYSPFDEYPTLFYRLAHAAPTEEGIRDFANHYGLLVAQIHSHRDRHLDKERTPANPLALWQGPYHHAAVRLGCSRSDQPNGRIRLAGVGSS